MGTSLDAGSKALAEVQVDRSTILVLGNEGHGVRTNVQRACDVQVRIEGGLTTTPTSSSSSSPVEGEGGNGNDDEGGQQSSNKGLPVDSLNVSVTGGILMHFLRQQATAAAAGATAAGDE